MSRNEMMMRRLGQLAREHATDEGRSLEELKKTKEILKGAESQRLRRFCTSERMVPGRDLDELGKAILMGDFDYVSLDFSRRIAEQMMTLGREKAFSAAAEQYYNLRWGPTETPIYNLLGLAMQLVPSQKEAHFQLARLFIKAKVPVDGTDLSGTTALSHCFSTKPSFELEYAQLLYDAGGDVNHRNRYGGIVAEEIIKIYDHHDREVVRKATAALEWFLNHGGNVDIADGDGYTPRDMCKRLAGRVPALLSLVEKEDEKRKAKGNSCCSLCGRDEEKLLTCGKCKKAKYCAPSSRACQKLDWPKHKKECKASGIVILCDFQASFHI
ncbi:hypothetical protein JR316_0006434 [Psilocybe cubensis]|nr:hypothetical protein JR316_0006434 [Psilocybe cubensis]KAH9481904.1 hypothetical protein JR316_0006434 [Psilocybe cubensis]